jgi:CHASE2 domain-containing sensor protein
MRWAASDEPRLAAAVQGRPVLVGFILPFEDRKTVPVPHARWEPGNASVPGVLVHAQILRSLLGGGLLHSLPVLLTLALTVAGAAFAFPQSGRRTMAFYGLFLLGLAAFGVALMALGWVLAPAGAALAATLGVSTRFTHDALVQARERATLRRAFGG